MRTGPVPVIRLGPCLLVAAVSSLAAISRPAGLWAQSEAEGVRVFETVQPETGRRSLHVMEGLSPDEVRAVQHALERAGFRAPWQSGVLDPFTRGALQSFQTRRGLAVCACVSLETLIELGLRTRVAETIVLEPPARAQAGLPSAELEGDPAIEAEAPPGFVDYGRYYPFGVIYSTPFIPVHHDPAHALAVTHGGFGAYVGFQAGGIGLGASASALTVRPPLAPFGRVPMPPNVVRGGR